VILYCSFHFICLSYYIIFSLYSMYVFLVYIMYAVIAKFVQNKERNLFAKWRVARKGLSRSCWPSVTCNTCNTALRQAYLRHGTSYQCRDTDPDRDQNLIICPLAHCQSSLKISCKSVRKSGNRQRNNDENITSLAEVNINKNKHICRPTQAS